MIKPEYYEDRFSVEDGRVVRTVTAVWPDRKRYKGGRLEVYRIDDEGREQCRGLWFSYYCGYVVDPTECGDWDEPRMTLQSFKNGCYSELGCFGKEDADTMCSVYPDFRYTLDKAGTLSKAFAMNLLIKWKKNPKVELLLAAGYRQLVYNGTFARMKPEKQKAVLAFIRKDENAKMYCLDEILFIMSGKGNHRDFVQWRNCRDRDGRQIPYKWWKKYGNKPVLYDMYMDYLQMARYCNHDVEEDYWKWPKNIKKAHDKVMVEYNRVKEAERMERDKAARKEEREKRKNFLKVVKKFEKSCVRSSGLKVFIPQDIKSVMQQARVLHQCLVDMDYIGRMARRNCMLVFIADNKGKPVATAEILPNGKIGQFYADQSGYDEETMVPNANASKALNKWLDKFKENAMKVMKEAA